MKLTIIINSSLQIIIYSRIIEIMIINMDKIKEKIQYFLEISNLNIFQKINIIKLYIRNII